MRQIHSIPPKLLLSTTPSCTSLRMTIELSSSQKEQQCGTTQPHAPDICCRLCSEPLQMTALTLVTGYLGYVTASSSLLSMMACASSLRRSKLFSNGRAALFQVVMANK